MMKKDSFRATLAENLKAFQNTSVIVIVKDLEDNILFMSDASKEVFHKKDVNYVGKKLSEVYPQFEQSFQLSDQYCVEHDGVENQIVKYTEDSNKIKWIKIDKMPYRDEAGVIIGFILFISDITSKYLLQIESEQLSLILNAHIKVEEVLKNTVDVEKFAEELSRSFVENKIFTAVMIERIHDYTKKDVSQYACWVDLDDTIHNVYERQFGFTNCLRNFLNNKADPFHKHDTHSNCPWNSVYKKTNSYVSTITYGSKIYGSVCLRLNTDDWYSSEKMKNLMNQLLEKIAFGFYSLETQQQINEIQSEMEEQLKIYKRALDATNDGIWDWDLTTNEVFYNDRYFTMLGLNSRDFPHTLETWKNIVHDEDLDLVFKIIQMEIENKSEGFEVEFRARTNTDKYVWILGRGKVYKRDRTGNPLKIVGTHVDITDLKEQEKELEKKNSLLENVNEELIANNEEIREMNKELEKLYKEQEDLSNQTARMLRLMGQISLLGTDETTFLNECLDLAFNMVSATTSGRITMLDKNTYTIMSTNGFSQKGLEGTSIRKNDLQIPEKTKILSKNQITQLYDVNAFLEEKLETAVSSVKECLITPIIWNGTVRGCIEMFNESDDDLTFAFSDLKRMDSFSNLLSVFYRLRKYMKDEGKFQTDLILTLVKTLEYYDAYTRGHSERVAIWSAELARVVGVDEEGQRQIYFASLMHDIGKIFVPQTVLNKATRLTEDEYSLIQSHSVKSAELINKVEGMENFANVVLHHHEKYDGTGYPEGLKGKAIPYFSRIIAVADTYDAMTSDRHYRKPFTEKRAVEELLRCKGTQFDPSLIDPFIDKVIRNKNLSIPKE